MLPLGSVGFCLIMCKLSEWNLKCLVINSFMLPSKVSSLWGNIIKAACVHWIVDCITLHPFQVILMERNGNVCSPLRKVNVVFCNFFFFFFFWKKRQLILQLYCYSVLRRNTKKLDFLRKTIHRLLFNDFFPLKLFILEEGYLLVINKDEDGLLRSKISWYSPAMHI